MMIKRTLCLALLAAMTLTGCDETGDELSAQDHEALTDEALGTPEELIDPNAPMPEDEGPVGRDRVDADGLAADVDPAAAVPSNVPWTISPAPTCLNDSQCSGSDICEPIAHPDGPVARCVGPCWSDADCDQGEECGGDGYCEVLLKGDWDFCENGGCMRGHGDCDYDSDCNGSLSCVRNIGTAWGYPTNSRAVCDYPGGHANYCSSAHPCGYGQGDCDLNSQCGFGLVCKDNRGGTFGFPGWVDVCLFPWQ